MAAKKGDTVRFLNDVGGGIVVRIDGNIAFVADEDGFETPMPVRECVVVKAAESQEHKPDKATLETYVAKKTATAPSAATPTAPVIETEKVEEVAGGDVLNVVLAFEAQDLKRLSQTSFDVYLVNDSNYYLYFSFMTKCDDNDGWTMRHAGVVEPNFQLLLDELAVEDLPEIDRIALQCIAFKRDRQFALKQPVLFESRLDTSRFARLHCFHDNVYFDEPVIAYDIVKNDVPQRPVQFPTIEETPTTAMPDVKMTKSRPVVRKQRSVRAQKNDEPTVVDLHIAELIDSTAGMSNADILNYQIDKFREVMAENLKYPGRKIVFIHGKGEGILRQALLKELDYRYKSCKVQDASFREYGYGATQVTIAPVKKS